MDPVTHAASGAIAMLAIKNRPVTAWAWPLAALACASPDIDLAFIHSPLQFLELHRGITHSFIGGIFLSLVLAIFFLPLWSKRTKNHWNFFQTWLFCYLMILLHIWLDVVTTYGTMVLLPFSHYRVRWNSLFIIDIFVTLPLLWALLRWRHKRKLALAALCWIFIYPAAGIGINNWHTEQWRQKTAIEEPGRLVVLPDVFMPFFWRVLYEQDGMVTDASINFWGELREEQKYKALPEPVADNIKASSLDGEVFLDFAVLPVTAPVPDKYLPENKNGQYRLIHDLRFGSGLEFVRKILAMRPNAERPFLLMLEQGPDDSIEKIRLRFSDSGRDSSWHKPVKPGQPSFWEWCIGIR